MPDRLCKACLEPKIMPWWHKYIMLAHNYSIHGLHLKEMFLHHFFFYLSQWATYFYGIIQCGQLWRGLAAFYFSSTTLSTLSKLSYILACTIRTHFVAQFIYSVTNNFGSCTKCYKSLDIYVTLFIVAALCVGKVIDRITDEISGLVFRFRAIQ